MKIAIVGGGLVGRSWALLFARAGFRVAVFDRDPAVLAGLHAAIVRSLEEMRHAGLLKESPADIVARIETVAELGEALADAGYVQENAPEQLAIKRALFVELDRLAPADAVLASSSSALTCSSIAADLPGRHRCIVAHPANPPHLLRAVEVVPAPFTSAATTGFCCEMLRRAGQEPVVIGEIDGFVMNRLQAALANEALALVESGIADADAVDAIVRFSLGLRWAFLGPFETMDLNAPGGFADYAERYGPAFAKVGGAERWSSTAVAAATATLRARMPIEGLKDRQQWRDRRLARLVAHLDEDAG